MEPDNFAATGDQVGDDDEISKLLAGANTGGGDFLADIENRELEIGEKADDAIDYGDISDDDLPDEEEEEDQGDEDRNLTLSGTTVHDSGDEGNYDEDLEALFNASSPPPEHSHDDPSQNLVVTLTERSKKTQPTFRDVQYRKPDEVAEDDPEVLEQRRLFEESRRPREERLPVAAITSREVFEQMWPGFEEGVPLRFYSLMPKRHAYYPLREPIKPPKPLSFGTKVNLDIAPDQEKSFRLPEAAVPNKSSRQDEEDTSGIISINKSVEKEDENADEMDLDNWGTLNEHEMIGNVSFGDLQIACEDWEVPDLTNVGTPPDMDEIMTPPFDLLGESPSKRRRLGDRENPISFSVYGQTHLPTWDDPEGDTAKLARKHILDMNDPHLLLDVQQPSAESKKPRTTGVGLKRDNRGSLANPMFKRYNISNDEAYDALKESSQQKVRGTIGHANIEHSLPALKLQYPFYKVALSDRELRSFHRPTMLFKPGERALVSSLNSVKRKTKRHQKPSEAFAMAADLNVGDNSDVLLAEYSEEYPTTLSNFGMGVKILNYYRRTSNEDNHRPKPPLGETSILLQHDKSPFSVFGPIEPGEEWLTLHNAMYRAPIFQHNVAQTDFLVSRSRTGREGDKYYMRNIDNLVVVGQEFPSVEVPGTHARKVTEASKKRLKMLAFRMYRKGQQNGHKQPWVSNEMIKHHLPGTEIAQNRSRMREIMKYVKETGTWEPMPGETIPDEPTLRTWIKPEDICLIDSMHAGDKQLQDAGIKTNEIQDDEEGDGNEALELKLAPWHTTKNFLNACTGKAMLTLHGEGDPTARGEGFSFIKTSMKGGFKDIGESMADKLDAKKQKENGGHSYNVQKQQQQYEDAIRRIWNKQKESLQSTALHSDEDLDADAMSRPNAARGRSEAPTPALMRGEDETMSQFSRNSANETRGKKLRITRMVRNKFDELEQRVVTVTDPEVIKLYLKRKKQQRLMNMNIDDIKPTGNAEFDHQQMLKLKAEMARLQRNMERREGREKAKGIHRSQQGDGATSKSGATPRKCANCGEVGHIKTNKKCAPPISSSVPTRDANITLHRLCPLLNGSKKQSDTFRDAGAASPATVAATPVPATPQVAGSPL